MKREKAADPICQNCGKPYDREETLRIYGGYWSGEYCSSGCYTQSIVKKPISNEALETRIKSLAIRAKKIEIDIRSTVIRNKVGAGKDDIFRAFNAIEDIVCPALEAALSDVRRKIKAEPEE